MKQPNTVVGYGSYAQSANVLFHFMDKFDYLADTLKRKALVPRYCLEDIAYLGLDDSLFPRQKVAILEKCFCDIPFHQLYTPSTLELVDDPPLPPQQAEA